MTTAVVLPDTSKAVGHGVTATIDPDVVEREHLAPLQTATGVGSCCFERVVKEVSRARRQLKELKMRCREVRVADSYTYGRPEDYMPPTEVSFSDAYRKVHEVGVDDSSLGLALATKIEYDDSAEQKIRGSLVLLARPVHCKCGNDLFLLLRGHSGEVRPGVCVSPAGAKRVPASARFLGSERSQTA